jgi:hypothetical protein
MNRLLRVAGWSYVAACAVGVSLALATNGDPAPQPAVAVVVSPTPDGSAADWFKSIKPFCNGVEVQVQLRHNPAPKTLEGAGYEAACYALAGRIDDARRIIDAVSEGERHQAVGIVFEVAHPVADAGDDKAAGPIMQMVVDYWPNHYMALYHAGMSEYILNQPDLARKHLESFLQYYSPDDGWRRNAIDVLRRIQGSNR